MRALILSGGGARGAYEAGVAVSLLEHEDFELACGASIGAINGALIAQGDLKERAAEALSARIERARKLRDRAAAPRALAA